MEINFELVDAGCFMYENTGGRWIIEHPRNGYLPTFSKKWDVLVEHPENPHKEPLKYLGSFNSKKSSFEFVKEKILKKENYFTVNSVENRFYNQDYSKK
jgi:hypothetical protein